MKNWLIKLIQNIGCDHDYKFEYNIYGDDINKYGGYRSVFQCQKCGKYDYRKDLYQTEKLYNTLNKLYTNYYNNKYENWCNSHKELLYGLHDNLIATAKKGLSHFEIVISCRVESNDRQNIETWLNNNNLYYTTKLFKQKEVNDVENAWLFEIGWN